MLQFRMCAPAQTTAGKLWWTELRMYTIAWHPVMYTLDWSTVEESSPFASYLFLIPLEEKTLSFLQFRLSRAMYQLPAFGLLLPGNLEG